MPQPMPSVGLVKIPVSDLERAATWYREVLGLPEDFAVPEYGWAQYGTGGVPLCLYEPGRGGGDGTPGGETGVHLVVEDAATLHEDLVGRNTPLPTPLTESDDGSVFFVAADPDGNRLKIVQASTN